jgi:hypothetical protein
LWAFPRHSNPRSNGRPVALARRREIPIKLNIARALFLGAIYGYIEEAFVNPTTGPLPPDAPLAVAYRIAYIALLILPFINLNYWIWVADGVLATIVQDVLFWVIDFFFGKGELPRSWAWYYPVLGHVPLLYIPAVPLIVYLYWKGAKHRID